MLIRCQEKIFLSFPSVNKGPLHNTSFQALEPFMPFSSTDFTKYVCKLQTNKQTKNTNTKSCMAAVSWQIYSAQTNFTSLL